MLLSHLSPICIALGVLSCQATTLSPSDRAELEAHAAKLAICQERGREAGTYQAYDDCVRDAGAR